MCWINSSDDGLKVTLEVREERSINQRSFPDWSMELVLVSASYFEANKSVSDYLPKGISQEVRDRIIRMTESISGIISL